MHKVLTGGDETNSVDGNHIGIDTKGSLIKNTDKEKIIGTIGLEDCIVVNTPDSLLVCKKERAVDVKKLVEKLEEKDNFRKFID